MTNGSYKMKNLVEISAMVTESTDFFNIKDDIIENVRSCSPYKGMCESIL